MARESLSMELSRGQQLLDKAMNFLESKRPACDYEHIFIMNQKATLSHQFPKKYNRRFASLNLLSNFNPLALLYPQNFDMFGSGLYPALEVSYHWGRAFDNIIDGDAEVPVQGMSVTDWMKRQKELAVTGAETVPKAPTIEYMLKRTLIRLNRMGSEVNIQDEMVKFIDAMEVEYDRRVNKKVLTRQELKDLNRDSFGSPHTITLVAVRSRAQGHDVWELGQIQGRIQALRDIHPELKKGICNIPAEVLDESNLTLSSLAANPQLFDTNTTLQEWKQQELLECAALMDQLKAKPLDKSAQLYVSYFFSEINKHMANLI